MDAPFLATEHLYLPPWHASCLQGISQTETILSSQLGSSCPQQAFTVLLPSMPSTALRHHPGAQWGCDEPTVLWRKVRSHLKGSKCVHRHCLQYPRTSYLKHALLLLLELVAPTWGWPWASFVPHLSPCQVGSSQELYHSPWEEGFKACARVMAGSKRSMHP